MEYMAKVFPKIPLLYGGFSATVNVAGDLHALWKHRELLFVLTRREIVSRYEQTFFGIGWSLLQPILQALVYTIAFSMILKSSGSEGIPFTNFIFANLTLWSYFSSGIVNAMNSLRSNAGLITKVGFPREIIPLSSILSGLFDFCVTFLVLLILNVFSGFLPNLRYFYIPAILLVEILFILNVSLVLSVVTVVRRDLTHIVTFFITLYMFLSPVFYPLSAFPLWMQELYFLNPMGTLIDAFKNIIFLNREPRGYAFVVVIVLLFILFIPCYRFFKRAEKYFADVL